MDEWRDGGLEGGRHAKIDGVWDVGCGRSVCFARVISIVIQKCSSYVVFYNVDDGL